MGPDLERNWRKAIELRVMVPLPTRTVLRTLLKAPSKKMIGGGGVFRFLPENGEQRLALAIGQKHTSLGFPFQLTRKESKLLNQTGCWFVPPGNNLLLLKRPEGVSSRALGAGNGFGSEVFLCGTWPTWQSLPSRTSSEGLFRWQWTSQRTAISQTSNGSRPIFPLFSLGMFGFSLCFGEG